MGKQIIPIDVVHLLPELDKKLIELLRSLEPYDWQKPTIAKLWTVKDVVAHLLDGNIRILSMLRDDYFGEPTNAITNQELIDFLNDLNASWVKAMKRVSPAMLILLHEYTGKLYCDYYASLDPFSMAGFAVNWAGENESKNWMHIAREYTEKWLHQQQVREAVGKPGLMNREYFYPFINTFMLALPYTYREVTAEEGTILQVTITGSTGGNWFIKMQQGQWQFTNEKEEEVKAAVFLDADTSWKLFSKSLRPHQVSHKVIIEGNQQLGAVALNMISVMA